MKKQGSREKVKVVCRIRPTNQKEILSGGVSCIKFTETNIEVNQDDGSNSFSFDRIFGPESTQIKVFEYTAVPLINDVLSGYNATIFAYGQTGTGKTHTMEGVIHSEVDKGIIPRAVEALFNAVLEADENIEFTFKVSYVEIYMEKIRDLLDENRLKTNLTVREDKIKGIYIAGVTEIYVTSHMELLGIMTAGATNRAVAATGMNEGSSRSHSVFTITVNQRDLNKNTTTSGKLVLVDLAGSEMVRKSNASGQQLEEAKTINKSLSALGQVIYALTDDKQTHIPYRDSKLTRILQDSLGGNAKTVLIVAVSPSSYNASETVSTLRFGMRAKSIENKVSVNQTRSVEELENLLLRAEKAIDIQSNHINSLVAQIEALQLSSSGDNKGKFVNNILPSDGNNISTEERTVFNKALAAAKAAEAKLMESNLLNESLQESITALTTEIDEEKSESSRKDSEIFELTQLLREKEQLLVEATEILQESQKQYKIQKDRCDGLICEKAESVGELENLKSQYSDDLDKLNFEKKELEVIADTLRSENIKLKKEIDEISGDDRNNTKLRPISDTMNTNITSDSKSVSGGRSQENFIDSDSNINMGSSVDNGGKIVTASNRMSTSYSGNDYTISINDTEFQTSLKDISATYNIEENALIAIKQLLEKYTQTYHNLMNQEFDNKRYHDKQVITELNKRLNDMSSQRSRLDKDLADTTHKYHQLQFEVDTMKMSLQGPDPKPGTEYLTAREKANMRSLQQRLEQLVVVHRQLLRKFSSMEFENSEYKRKILLRDDRIKQLEISGKSLMTSMRQQAERHVHELTYLREQIQLIRTEHNLRMESKDMTSSQFPSSSSSTSGAIGLNGVYSSREIRTVRGGHGSVEPVVTNVIRGKNKSISSPNQTSSISSNLFLDPLGLNSSKDINPKDDNKDPGSSSPKSTKSIFSRLLGQS